MFSFRTTNLYAQEDLVLSKGKVSVICNQTAWSPQRGEYMHQEFIRRGNLKRVMVPFADSLYNLQSNSNIEFKYLSSEPNRAVAFESADFKDTDAIVFEMQDVGSRYFSVSNIVMALFSFLEENGGDIPVYLVDRINPAGRQVEGTALTAGYRSHIGIEGLPHRYGLTIGEVANYIYTKIGCRFPLHIISYKATSSNKLIMPWSIPPSDNFSRYFTFSLFSGQYLWKGTNVSCAEGTGMAYEMFGAPFLKDKELDSNPLFKDSGVFARRISFTEPAQKESKQAEQTVNYGYQLLLSPDYQYNALAHNLRLMRCVKDACPEFVPLQKEEASEHQPLEQLLGDKQLINFVLSGADWEQTKEHIKLEEQRWIKKAKKLLLYPTEPLFRIK
ncbi:MAG: DUF1343 domain-containing protein [Bacteroidales bacterium]|nr:DUF1343 domain-containing protein [Bacteroidales bacterium]